MIRRRDFVGAGMFAAVASSTSIAALALQRRQRRMPTGRDKVLASLPERIGRWSLNPVQASMVAPVEFDGAFAEALSLYDRVVSANYGGPGLPLMALNIAYMRELRQERKFHWPEICYATQGYDVSRLLPQSTERGGQLPIARFLARSADHAELVAYTMRVGDYQVINAAQLRRALFMDGLALKIPDGFLIRASLSNKKQHNVHNEDGWIILRYFISKIYTQIIEGL